MRDVPWDGFVLHVSHWRTSPYLHLSMPYAVSYICLTVRCACATPQLRKARCVLRRSGMWDAVGAWKYGFLSSRILFLWGKNAGPLRIDTKLDNYVHFRGHRQAIFHCRMEFSQLNCLHGIFVEAKADGANYRNAICLTASVNNHVIERHSCDSSFLREIVGRRFNGCGKTRLCVNRVLR